MRFVLLIIIVGGAAIGIAMNASHEFLVPYEENIVWMKEGKLESAPQGGGAHGVATGVIPPDALAFAPMAVLPNTSTALDFQTEFPSDQEQAAQIQPDQALTQEAQTVHMLMDGESATGLIAHGEGEPILFPMPSVVDAGRLRSAGTIVVIEGVSALHRDKLCYDEDDRPWLCGRRAAAALSALVRGRSIECDPPRGDARVIAPGIYPAIYRAHCRVGGVDIARWLVRNGWATPIDPRLKTEARAAQMARVGQWSLEARAFRE